MKTTYILRKIMKEIFNTMKIIFSVPIIIACIIISPIFFLLLFNNNVKEFKVGSSIEVTKRDKKLDTKTAIFFDIIGAIFAILAMFLVMSLLLACIISLKKDVGYVKIGLVAISKQPT